MAEACDFDNPFDLETGTCIPVDDWDKKHDNPFSMFPPETRKEAIKFKKAVDELKKIVKESARKLREAEKKYSYFGVGDTATDEAIVGEIYDRTHFYLIHKDEYEW